MDIYELVRGPLAWVALIVFVFGSLYRIVFLLLTGKKEPALDPSRSRKDAARSILHGLIPLGATYMRDQPFFSIVSFIFHVCVLILPIFLLAHIVLWYESWEIQWWSLPDLPADLMTLWVILACVYFILRRLLKPEIKQVTRPVDLGLLIIILTTFLTGFLAYHQWGPYRPVLILHILFSEILLVVLPFSKLGHMLFFGFSRAYMGSEFGRHLKVRDW
ncbi:MAG: nitrate reductase [Deltaproteobacteria bacterium]|nr:nitrate reductase [Deltaproteobacteria bacterium]